MRFITKNAAQVITIPAGAHPGDRGEGSDRREHGENNNSSDHFNSGLLDNS